MELTKYIIRATSPNSGMNGFVGENYGLFKTIDNARLYNDKSTAQFEADKITKKKYWLSPIVESIEIEIHI